MSELVTRRSSGSVAGAARFPDVRLRRNRRTPALRDMVLLRGTTAAVRLRDKNAAMLCAA